MDGWIKDAFKKAMELSDDIEHFDLNEVVDFFTHVVDDPQIFGHKKAEALAKVIVTAGQADDFAYFTRLALMCGFACGFLKAKEKYNGKS